MKRLRSIAVIMTVLIAVLSGSAIYIVLDGVTDRLNHAETQSASDRTRSAADRAELQSANAKVEALGQQVRALGEKPVVEPSTPLPQSQRYIPIPGPQGAPGTNGQDGVSVAGPQGQAGKDAAPAQNGKDGADGTDGKDGADGAPGKDGRGIVSGPVCDDDGNLVTTFDQEPFTESNPADACKPLVVVPSP